MVKKKKEITKKEKKSRYLENETLFFLQMKKLIGHSSRTTF